MSLFRKTGPSGEAALALALLFGPPAAAETRASPPAVFPPLLGTTEQVASDPRSGLALSGYDPVGYLVEGRARPGLARHEASLGGVAWRFGSEANRAAFLRDPEAFRPRLGGYDAVAAASGRAVAADPLLFVVRAGGLYLFRTQEGRDRFLAEDGAAEASERGWRRIRPGLVAD